MKALGLCLFLASGVTIASTGFSPQPQQQSPQQQGNQQGNMNQGNMNQGNRYLPQFPQQSPSFQETIQSRLQQGQPGFPQQQQQQPPQQQMQPGFPQQQQQPPQQQFQNSPQVQGMNTSTNTGSSQNLQTNQPATIEVPVNNQFGTLPEFENQESLPVMYDQKNKNLRWIPCAGIFPKGCEVSVLHGTLGSPETDSYVKVPPNYKFPPHTQSSPMHLTMISGKLRMKYLFQDAFNLTTGNFVFLPPELPRESACVSKEPCLFIVHFDGPSVMSLYNGKI